MAPQWRYWASGLEYQGMVQVPTASPGSSPVSALSRNPLYGRAERRATLRYWPGSRVSASREILAGWGWEEELGKPWRGTRSLQAARGAPRW